MVFGNSNQNHSEIIGNGEILDVTLDQCKFILRWTLMKKDNQKDVACVNKKVILRTSIFTIQQSKGKWNNIVYVL
ncbi:hypothetical protein CR513_22833, partial [Mucuna pruriens]